MKYFFALGFMLTVCVLFSVLQLCDAPCLFALAQTAKPVPITSDLPEHYGNINSLDYWDNIGDTSWAYSIIEIKPGSEISFKCYGMFFLAFLTSYSPPRNSEIPSFSKSNVNLAGRLSFRAGKHKMIAPKDAHYIFFSRRLRGIDATPKYLYVDHDNVLEGKKIITENLNSDSNYQQVCIHHDSFCRNADGPVWNIGSNGGEVFGMDYYSPLLNYKDEDDGFRLFKSFLVNDTTVSVAESFRLIRRLVSERFFIEISFPKADRKYERIVYDFAGERDFNSFVVFCDEKWLTINCTHRNNGFERVECIYREQVSGNCLRFLYDNGSFVVFLDDKELCKYKSAFNNILPVGLMVDKTHLYEYRFFNVFNIEPYKIYDENIFIEKGVKQTNLGIPQGWEHPYSYTLDSTIVNKSLFSERFELRRSDVTNKLNNRTEKSFNYELQNNLRKIHISFDLYVPNGYENDSSPDCIVQIHDRPDDNKLEGRSPYFAIRIKDLKFYLTAMSIERNAKNGFNVNNIIPLCDVKLGKWTHFDIYLKEGYLPEHNPLTSIEIDGILYFLSKEPNCNNNPRGGYLRYGIYKADWFKGRGGERNRVVYFDNFRVIM